MTHAHAPGPRDATRASAPNGTRGRRYERWDGCRGDTTHDSSTVHRPNYPRETHGRSDRPPRRGSPSTTPTHCRACRRGPMRLVVSRPRDVHGIRSCRRTRRFRRGGRSGGCRCRHGRRVPIRLRWGGDSRGRCGAMWMFRRWSRAGRGMRLEAMVSSSGVSEGPSVPSRVMATREGSRVAAGSWGAVGGCGGESRRGSGCGVGRRPFAREGARRRFGGARCFGEGLADRERSRDLCTGCRRGPISVVAVETGKDRGTVLGRWK